MTSSRRLSQLPSVKSNKRSISTGCSSAGWEIGFAGAEIEGTSVWTPLEEPLLPARLLVGILLVGMLFVGAFATAFSPHRSSTERMSSNRTGFAR